MTTTVTLDTNVTPPEAVTALVPADQFDFAVVSVTDRETAGTGFQITFKRVGRVVESGVWGESTRGNAVWGTHEDTSHLERILSIISNDAFPRPGHRSVLTPAQRRQLRDAMIFSAHVRESRDVFVTSDTKAFVKNGRRERFEREFATRIMTPAEFVATHGPSPG